MAFAQRLDMRQSQQLVMTPQLQQAIKMLQMSNLELRDFITEELERNPLLETAENAPETRDTAAEPAAGAEAKPDAERPLEQSLAEDRLDRADQSFETGADNMFADESRADRTADRMAENAESAPSLDSPGGAEAIEAGAWATVGAGGSSRFDDDEFGIEARLTKETTLREALLAQLGEAKCDLATRMVAADLIENLDPAGYIRQDLQETADRLGAPLTAVEAAAALIRTFEPTGVGARDLCECLRLQLEEQNRFDPAMAALLENLQLVAKRDYDKLKRLCRVDAEDLLEMLNELKALDPKPGARYEQDLAPTVIPDVFVYENRVGGWNVELNTETLPRLVVNNGYAAEVLRGAADGDRGAAVKEFVSERQQSANWLLKSIEQRARTILRVATRNRPPTGWFLRLRRLRPASAQSEAGGRRDRHARVDRQPRDF